MTHASLFSGIGGFDLAAEWMGWENIFHCEINEFGQKILKHYWPNAITYTDITKTDFTIHRGTVDVLTGGFPCQPYSVAGKRLGKEDERHLWPEMLRAVREIRPRWIVGENVSGLVSWNGGMVFNEVQADLEAEGYEILPFLLPACGKNAPHKRERVWFIAYAGNNGFHGTKDGQGNRAGNDCNSARENTVEQFKGCGSAEYNWANPYTTSNRLQGGGDSGELRNERSQRGQRFKDMGLVSKQEWQNFPTEPPVCNGNDGLPAKLDGIAFSKWRKESIKAGGNAIVPQVALEIFKAIEAYELTRLTLTTI